MEGSIDETCYPKGKAEMEPFVNIQAAAEFLNVKVSWLYEQVRLNCVPSYKIGSFRRFKLSELEAWARNPA
jgi:excisionase family DNA binding protein